MHQLETIINAAFENRATLNSENAEPAFLEAVSMVIAQLNAGTLRVAEKIDGIWQVNQWVKKAVLLHFCLSNNTLIKGEVTNYFDKVKLKYAHQTAEQFKLEQVRIVPPACIRDGVYIGANCVIMPSYLNIGAYVDSRSMIDIWATVGSCAQIGKNCHISSNVCVGGVLEPLQANPVIIEDNCFVGTGAAIVEGVIVEEGAVIGMGVKIGQSTKIFDRETGEIYYGRVPAGAVVVPGSLPSKSGTYNTECAIIVKTVDAKTRAKVSINELLRESE